MWTKRGHLKESTHGLGCSTVAECLTSTSKALGSIHSTTNKYKKKKLLMQVIGYDDAHFEHEFKASLCYMNSCLKKMGGGGEKVKGHKDQWVKSTCYINVNTWVWSPGPHKSWHAAWTSGLPQSWRQTGDSWQLTGQLSSLAYAAGKQRPCHKKGGRWWLTHEVVLWSPRVHWHMHIHVHMCEWPHVYMCACGHVHTNTHTTFTK